MADWFKFYENDLDETRLQYAISKLPEVVSVWVGILSEACRHKSGTVSWGVDSIELFGFSRRLGLTVSKVNEGVRLLVEIRYITLQDDKMTIIKWGEKQSEYCQKLTKRQNQGGQNNPNIKPTVGTVSGQSRDSVGQEERRGEENRGEQGAPLVENFPEAERPSKEEFFAYFETQACLLPAKWYIEDKWLAAESDNWKGKENWRAYARRVKGWWDSDGRPMNPPKKNGKPERSTVVGGRM